MLPKKSDPIKKTQYLSNCEKVALLNFFKLVWPLVIEEKNENWEVYDNWENQAKKSPSANSSSGRNKPDNQGKFWLFIKRIIMTEPIILLMKTRSFLKVEVI